jgi:hypothetical protein
MNMPCSACANKPKQSRKVVEIVLVEKAISLQTHFVPFAALVLFCHGSIHQTNHFLNFKHSSSLLEGNKVEYADPQG